MIHQKFVMPPVTVSRTFRELLLATYPALSHSLHAAIYRRMAQYFLFTTFLDEGGRIIVPYKTIALLVGVNPHAHGFSAHDWLELFDTDVMPLDISDYTYAEGQARAVAPKIALPVLNALRAERSGEADSGKIWFVDSIPVSRRNLKAACDDYQQYLLSLSQAVDADHPAHRLIQYALSQPPDTLRRVLGRNWPLVRAAVNGLPVETPRQQATRQWCERLLTSLDTYRGHYYADSPRTPRIFAVGTTVHQFSRALRRIAFSGETECDLRACQLAAVARLWNIPSLQEFLLSGASIWSELLDWVRVPPTCKGIIKRSVYSIVFGMSKKRLIAQLAEGDAQDDGIGADASERFFQHPMIVALLAARGQQQRAVWAAGGCADAWGHWLEAKWNDGRQKKDVPSVLAYAVQSYEMRIMLSVLPVLESEPQVSLLSWLHDGCTIHFGNVTKEARQEERLKAAVRREAEALGIATWLEVERLPTMAQVIESNQSLCLAV